MPMPSACSKAGGLSWLQIRGLPFRICLHFRAIFEEDGGLSGLALSNSSPGQKSSVRVFSHTSLSCDCGSKQSARAQDHGLGGVFAARCHSGASSSLSFAV